MIKISVHSIIRHFMIYIIMYRIKLIYFFCINYAKLSHIFVFFIIPHFILILIFFILFLRTVLLTFSPFQFILYFILFSFIGMLENFRVAEDMPIESDIVVGALDKVINDLILIIIINGKN